MSRVASLKGTNMRAVGYTRSLPIEHAEALVDVAAERPRPAGRDLLVEVRAVSVNPVDYKVRLRAEPSEGETKILGWDAAGIVAEAGEACSLFTPGDAVFYAGALGRQGANAEFHLVDERLVGRKPRSLSHEEAAALPLTSITAWEMLFHRFGLRRGSHAGEVLLVVGGAGGVGSIAVQLARRLTGITVVATASRPETRAWCLELGAHHVVDHAGDLPGQMRALGMAQAGYVFSTSATDAHWPAIVEIVAPQGKVGVIDDPEPFDARLLKGKSASLHWELMFTRSTFATADMQAQHDLLCEVADLVDAGTLRTTLAETLGPISAATLRRAHALLESGRTRGKLVLAGF